MPLQQEFWPTTSLSVNQLKHEMSSIMEALTPEDLMQITCEEPVLDANMPTISDYKCHQKAGVAAETIVLTFASKVAYDVWKQIILPKLKAHYGGGAMSPASALRKTE